MKIPVYKLLVDEEDLGVDYVALVDYPAIERNFQAFSKQQRFQITDEEKRRVSGPLMVADLPIYRNDPQMGEYYAVFERSTIELIVKKYFQKKFTANVNLMHDPARTVEDVYMIESFFINRERGLKPPKNFEGLTDGSWFGTYQVDNNEVWENFIKTGELKGFSVEGMFKHELDSEKPEDLIDEIINLIDSIK